MPHSDTRVGVTLSSTDILLFLRDLQSAASLLVSFCLFMYIDSTRVKTETLYKERVIKLLIFSKYIINKQTKHISIFSYMEKAIQTHE